MSKQREWNLFERTGESAHDVQWELVRDEKGVCLTIPDHPALPAVSRWLAGTPGAVETLSVIANAAARNRDVPMRHIGNMGDLIAALTEGQG